MVSYPMSPSRLRSVALVADADESNVYLNVTNGGTKARRMMARVMDAVGDPDVGDNGYRRDPKMAWEHVGGETATIEPSQQRRLVLPPPAMNKRYIARIRLWDLDDDDAPWSVNLIAVPGSPIGETGLTTAGYTAWLTDDDLPIWGRWAISSVDGLVFTQ